MADAKRPKWAQFEVKEKTSDGVRAIITGEEGSGKTFLASSDEKGRLLDADDGAKFYDIPRIPMLDWDATDLYDFLDAFIREPIGNLHFDTLTSIVRIITAEVCKKEKVEELRKVAWGGGQDALVDELLKQLLNRLDKIVRMGHHVIIYGHSTIKMVKDPSLPQHEQAQARLHQKSQDLIAEWCDLWGNLSLQKSHDGEGGVVKSQTRVLHVTESADIKAKNRFGLKEPIIDPSWPKIFELLGVK